MRTSDEYRNCKLSWCSGPGFAPLDGCGERYVIDLFVRIVVGVLLFAALWAFRSVPPHRSFGLIAGIEVPVHVSAL